MDEARRALVLELSRQSKQRLLALLTELGYEAQWCGSLEEACGMVEQSAADLILVELLRSGASLDIRALEMLRQVTREAQPSIVALLEDGGEAEVVRCLGAGADDCVFLPLRLRELAARVQHAALRRSRYRALQHSNEQLSQEKKLLSQYLSDDIVNKLLSNGGETTCAGANLVASIMFFDLRDSTRLGEQLAPARFSEFLSELFTDIMDLVYTSHGSVNKLIGDGLLATFGAPTSSGRDAYNCVRCALRIREYLHMFNSARPSYLEHPIRAGMGIATGTVFAGSLGSYRRMEYTVLGDAVNVASRLQSLSKLATTDLLIEGETQRATGEAFHVERVQFDAVRGRIATLDIYKVLNATATP